MFYLVFVVLSTSVGLVTSYDRDLPALGFGDRTSSFKDNRGFHRDRLKRPKFVDVFTNHPNEKEVENLFYKNYNLPQKKQEINKNTGIPIDRKDTFSFQNLDVLSSQNKDFLESEHGSVESDNFDGSESNFGNSGSEDFANKYEYDRNTYYYPHATNTKTKNFYHKLQKNKKKDKLFPDEGSKNFVFMQSQMAIPDSENLGSFYAPSFDSEYDLSQTLRPNFMTKKANFTGSKLQHFQENEDEGEIVTSHVQKIPLFKRRSTTAYPETSETDSNKYEEVDLFESHKSKNKTVIKATDTRKRISDLLKKYVTKLFIDKYAMKKVDGKRPVLDNETQHLLGQNVSRHHKNPKVDTESKLFSTDTLWDLKNKTITKIKNLFSIFTVIKFDNAECNATNWAGTWQGVCYTSAECDNMGGTALGNCANGYGVCCVFRGTCGDSSSMNCSYFKSPNYPDFYPSNGDVITPTTTTVGPSTTFPTPDPRFHWYYYNQGNGDEELDILMKQGRQNADAMSCTFSVSKSDPDVQYMRIDFIDLDLAGPTNGTCTNERLIISGQNANDRIPVICGYNTGQHVYVDVSQSDDPLQLMILSATGASKRFKLRICQYTDSCGTPQGNCLQYYTGVSGIIESLNYDQAAMFNRSSPGYFNNLNYAICIRREDGYCSITYTNVRNGQTNPFQLVNRLPNGQLTIPAGQAGVDILNCPDDYIIIDGTRLCGARFNDGSTALNFTMNAPVTDTSAGPIVINVRTNNNVTGLGFKLYYMQNPCPTNR